MAQASGIGGDGMLKKVIGIFVLLLAISSIAYATPDADNAAWSEIGRLQELLNLTEDVHKQQEIVDLMNAKRALLVRPVPKVLHIGNTTVIVENATDEDDVEVVRAVLSLFPSYDVKGLGKVVFNETPLDNKGLHHKMLYRDGNITIRPGLRSRLEQAEYAGIVAHEVGHHLIRYRIADVGDIERFASLHRNQSVENFVTQYAKDGNYGEDFSEGVSFWMGNTRLFWKISQRNWVMREKFLITARQFCRNNTCVIYKSSSTASPDLFSGRADYYGELFDGDLAKSEIKVSAINFSEFAKVLNN